MHYFLRCSSRTSEKTASTRPRGQAFPRLLGPEIDVECRRQHLNESRRRVMERRIVNPWTWQDQMGYVQANDVSGAQRTIFLAGQGSVDGEGSPVHPGDM